ncbi:MAG: DNA-directed RNA polymerase subunit beta', partial [Chitinophagaceae bacterium]
VVEFGNIKRGNREIVVEAKDGIIKKYLVPLTRQILVQEGDFVKAGTPLSDGQIAPADILSIRGPFAVQEYVVNEIQEVYRLQGVKINDKHIEVIVRQMMKKVEIVDAGDTKFLEEDLEDRFEFNMENDRIFDKKVVIDAGESASLKPGQILSLRALREENSILRRADKKLPETRDAHPATAQPVLLGITKASLGVQSWISAASFQETTKVLSTAAIQGKTDDMMGLKENVITGHPIPAGTGMREFENMIVGNKEEYELLNMTREAMNFDEEE